MLAERVIRSFKAVLRKKIFLEASKNWPSMVKDVCETLNSRLHRSIGLAPNEVTEKNARLIFRRLHPELGKNIQPATGLRPLFSIGQRVRIITPTKTFTKGDLPRASAELYIISKIYFHPTIRFILRDLESKEIISGSFSHEELVKAGSDEE